MVVVAPLTLNAPFMEALFVTDRFPPVMEAPFVTVRLPFTVVLSLVESPRVVLPLTPKVPPTVALFVMLAVPMVAVPVLLRVVLFTVVIFPVVAPSVLTLLMAPPPLLMLVELIAPVLSDPEVICPLALNVVTPEIAPAFVMPPLLSVQRS